MPKALPPAVLKMQDEYLAERAREKGIVSVSEIGVSEGSVASEDGSVFSVVGRTVVADVPVNSESMSFFIERMYLKKMAKLKIRITAPATMMRMNMRFLLIRRASPM